MPEEYVVAIRSYIKDLISTKSKIVTKEEEEDNKKNFLTYLKDGGKKK
jgi:hypothetical protein